MGRIEAIISQLNTIAENPAKAIEDYKKATGKGAVGVMPLYVPEEIIHASRLSSCRHVGRTEKGNIQGKNVSATICLLHYAVRHGIAAGRSL